MRLLAASFALLALLGLASAAPACMQGMTTEPERFPVQAGTGFAITTPYWTYVTFFDAEGRHVWDWHLLCGPMVGGVPQTAAEVEIDVWARPNPALCQPTAVTPVATWMYCDGLPDAKPSAD